MTRPLQVERALYRGFVFVMDCYEVRVERQDGRRIGSARTLSGARRLVKGYVKGVGSLAEGRSDGSVESRPLTSRVGSALAPFGAGGTLAPSASEAPVLAADTAASLELVAA